MTATTYGGMPLLGPGASGAAFELRSAPKSAALVTVDGWEVEIAAGHKLVVARGGSADNYDQAVGEGAVRAQQGLDLMSVAGSVNGTIDRPEDLNLAWFATTDGVTLAARSVIQSYLSVGAATVVVTRPDGTVVPSPSQPQLGWHPSFRYWRLAQTTDDLFDGYRNVYLALEAILSDIAPQRQSETEGAWITRALKAANALKSFEPLVPEGTTNPIEYVRTRLYADTRTAVSHAKAGRRVLLPHDTHDRSVVMENLRLGSELYVLIAEAHLGLRRGGGFVAPFGFKAMVGVTMQAMQLGISDDPSPLDLTVEDVNPAGGTVLYFDTPQLLDDTVPFELSRTWTIDPGELARLDAIRRVVTVVDNRLGMLHQLEGELIIGDDVDRLVFTFSHRGVNTGIPKHRYPL
jgi:hypothetical protein